MQFTIKEHKEGKRQQTTTVKVSLMIAPIKTATKACLFEKWTWVKHCHDKEEASGEGLLWGSQIHFQVTFPK